MLESVEEIDLPFGRAGKMFKLLKGIEFSSHKLCRRPIRNDAAC